MKRERLAKMKTTKTSPASGVDNKSQLSESKKVDTEDDKKERRVIKMVVLNGIFNFFLRVPDALFWIGYHNLLLIAFNNQIFFNINQFMPGFFILIADICYFAYILTFTTNFIIFYEFNKNFREAVVFFYTTATKK
jgi:hypothetical protein